MNDKTNRIKKRGVEKMKSVLFLIIVSAFIIKVDAQQSETFTDSRDGNVYKTVKIGNQVWMAENLKYLPSVVGPETGSETIPYYYVYDYNGTVVADAKRTFNYTTYGVLYNWSAAKAACPTGWHLPSDAEWTQLTDYLGGSRVAGMKLKETGTTHWTSHSIRSTNETGFTALPGGRALHTVGNFDYIGYYGYWPSATEYGPIGAWFRWVSFSTRDVIRNFLSKELGSSVRCLKD